ncbi:tetratricopeptide repeat protein, partial [Porticoccaceae bacterium]|nr:tetratricopeptide repeat protein [Porticoccaceae bacterium]
MIEIVSATNPGDLLSENQQAEVNTAADQLKENHSNSAYAQFAAMLKAKLAVDNQDLDTAVLELQWALDNNPAPATERLVRLRLARVEAARGNVDSALQMVQGIDAAEMKSAYEEAKGDFYLLQDNGAAAFTAYESALASNESQDPMIRNILQLKISQVRPAEIAEMVEDDSEGVAE